ncbi:MAG TPA: FAD-dependent oxidoreductase [Polyangiaceae bacterium]|nr:FAD-dependent oxidoreductase [Polyangiaceae bacterium]
MKVAVVGAGFAGLAAAFAAQRAGASVTVVQQGAGGSALYAGVVDGSLAGLQPASLGLLNELSRALGLQLSPTCVVATREGVVRAANGADQALLDLAPLAGKRIGLVDVPRDDWDAPLLLRSFNESEWARATSTSFALLPLPLLEKGHQRRVSTFDFAVGLERAERPGWLAELLKAHAGPDAWLFGPWLGIKQPLARELSAAAGVPVGEVTSPPGGAAGARFELRRDALLRSLGVEQLAARLVSVQAADSLVTLRLEGGSSVSADALVLATGGLVSGAVELSGSLSGAEPAGFELTIAGLPPLEMHGELGRPVSSLFGVDLATRGRLLLERVGLAAGADGHVPGAWRVLAAGDLLAPAPPSVGHALVSGLLAGARAAQSA